MSIDSPVQSTQPGKRSKRRAFWLAFECTKRNFYLWGRFLSNCQTDPCQNDGEGALDTPKDVPKRSKANSNLCLNVLFFKDFVAKSAGTNGCLYEVIHRWWANVILALFRILCIPGTFIWVQGGHEGRRWTGTSLETKNSWIRRLVVELFHFTAFFNRQTVGFSSHIAMRVERY